MKCLYTKGPVTRGSTVLSLIAASLHIELNCKSHSVAELQIEMNLYRDDVVKGVLPPSLLGADKTAVKQQHKDRGRNVILNGARELGSDYV